MHRGSSKGPAGPAAGPEHLPLSASPADRYTVDVEIHRGGRTDRRTLEVASGTQVRQLLRELGQAPEGSAVWLDDEPIPLDMTIDRPARLRVVPTFSGG